MMVNGKGQVVPDSIYFIALSIFEVQTSAHFPERLCLWLSMDAILELHTLSVVSQVIHRALP